MSKKLTPWFPASVKPARVGRYEARFADNSGSFRFWNGYEWVFDDDRQCSSELFNANFHGAKWRGLAKKPARSA